MPVSIRNKIEAECSNHYEKISALADYMVTIIPGITWETIVTALYRCDEVKAVEQAKPYLHTVPGES